MKNKKTVFFLAILSLIGVFVAYEANYYLEYIDFTSLSVYTSGGLQKDKVKIEKGCFTINRKNDAELFDGGDNGEIVFDGRKKTVLKTDYGENDFLITYDNKYYYQFRHFIFNSHDKYSYSYILFRRGDSIYIQADIKGDDGRGFVEPMHLVSDASKLRFNSPIDDKQTVYKCQ